VHKLQCITFSSLYVCTILLHAQKPFSYYIATHYGSIIPHSIEVQNTSGAHPVGIETGIGFTDTSDAIFNRGKCIATSGLNLMYFDYNSKILGSSLGLNYFFEPSFRLSKSIRYVIRGQFGFIYLSNPYHPHHNNTNMSYSTRLSFFLGISTGFSWQLNPHWQTAVYGNFLHTSNGGLKDPNKGINWPTAQWQVSYFPKAFSPTNKKKRIKEPEKQSGITIYGLYSSRLLNVGDKVRYSLFGMGTESFIQLGSVSGLMGGVEIYEDYSLKKKLDRLGLSHLSSIRSGVTAGHVFLLGRIQFSQQVGFYVYSPSPFFDKWYHRWGLNYCANKNWVLGFSLKAHRHVANFVDVRVGYRIGLK